MNIYLFLIGKIYLITNINVQDLYRMVRNIPLSKGVLEYKDGIGGDLYKVKIVLNKFVMK